MTLKTKSLFWALSFLFCLQIQSSHSSLIFKCVDNDFFLINSQQFDFDSAQISCQLNDASLIAIESNEDIQEIIQLRADLRANGPLWVGLFRDPGTDFNATNVFKFVDQDPNVVNNLDFVHGVAGDPPWVLNEPNGTGELCVSLNSNNLLESSDCSSPFGFVCKKNEEEVCTFFNNPVSKSDCIGEDLYEFHVAQATYAEANAFCQTKSSKLARVSSFEEINLIETLRETISFPSALPDSTLVESAWVGIETAKLSGSNQQSDFYFTDNVTDEIGVELDNAFLLQTGIGSPWSPGQPDGSARCVRLEPSNRFDDLTCEIKLHVVCKTSKAAQCVATATPRPTKEPTTAEPTPNPTLEPTNEPTTGAPTDTESPTVVVVEVDDGNSELNESQIIATVLISLLGFAAIMFVAGFLFVKARRENRLDALRNQNGFGSYHPAMQNQMQQNQVPQFQSSIAASSHAGFSSAAGSGYLNPTTVGRRSEI